MRVYGRSIGTYIEAQSIFRGKEGRTLGQIMQSTKGKGRRRGVRTCGAVPHDLSVFCPPKPGVGVTYVCRGVALSLPATDAQPRLPHPTPLNSTHRQLLLFFFTQPG